MVKKRASTKGTKLPRLEDLPNVCESESQDRVCEPQAKRPASEDY